MDITQIQLIKTLFDAAFELAPVEREHFLVKECNGDFSVFAEVQKLLHFHESNDDFLETPPPLTHLAELSSAGNGDTTSGRRIGHYQIMRELGRGGMARVFLAQRADETYEKQVAIKLIHDQTYNEATRLRFLRERQILARLEHPKIARLLDAGTTETETPYFVMELVNGLPINQFCRQHELSLTARLQLFRQVCEAVQYAHQNLVIHRDLKPSNILVLPDGTPKLLDFGIAKLLEESDSSTALTKTQFPFTPEYASPEQVNQEPINTATDIYSLGILLYELLTGKKPYDLQKLSLSQIARTITEVEPTVPKLNYELDNILLRALRKEPAARYQSVEQFAEDIRRYLQGEPVLARPTSFAYRTEKLLRKNKLAVALASVLFLTLLTILITSIRQNFSAQQKTREQRRSLYATQMNQSLQDWELGSLERMRTTLKTWQPQTNQEDLRSFEWNYLWHLSHNFAASFHLPAADLSIGFGFYDKGNYVSVVDRQAFRLWDAKTGQFINESNHANFTARQMLRTENNFPILFSDKNVIQIKNLRTGEIIQTLNTPHLSANFFDLKAEQIITGHADGSVKIWDIAAKKIIHSTQVQSAPVGELLATPVTEKILTHPAKNNWLLVDPVKNTAHAINVENATEAPTFSNDNHYFYARETNAAVRVYDTQTNKELIRIAISGENILFVRFSPDAKHIVVTSTDSAARMYELPSAKLIATFKSNSSWIRYVDFSPNGKQLLATCADLTVKLWEINSQQEQAVIKGHEGTIFGAIFSPDGKKILTWSSDETAKIWDVAEVLKPKVIYAHNDHIFSVAFAPDNKFLASASQDKTVKLWASSTGELIRTFNGHTSWVFSVAFAPDGKTIATGSQDHSVRLWEVATGKTIKMFLGHSEPVRSVAFSPDGTRLVTASSDATIRVWDIQTGQEIKRLSGHKGEIYSVSYAFDGRHILSAGYDQTARLWDAQTGGEIRVLKAHKDAVWAAKFSPDGKKIATASADHSIKIWDTQTGAELATMRGHAHDIFALAWSPDGARLATASNDRTVRLWNVNLGMEVLMTRNHSEQVWSVAFSPDGKTLASASWDKTIRLWRTE